MDATPRTLVVHSMLAGLTPLVPLPLLDDWILDRVRRRLVEQIATAAGHELTTPEDGAKLRLLADKDVRQWNADGCVRGCLYRSVVVPLRFVLVRIIQKMVRKILFFLAVKDAVDEFSRTFQHAWLVRHAFASQPLPATIEDARALRATIDSVVAEVDPRPLESATRASFRHSRRWLRRGARVLGRTARAIYRRGDEELEWVDDAAAEADEAATGLVDELVAGLRREEGYLRSLELRLERRLDDAAGSDHASVA